MAYLCGLPESQIAPSVDGVIGMKILQVLKQALKYSLTTLLGTGADTLVLWLLSTYVFDGNHWEQYVLSPMISFECAVIVNYMTAFFYVWRDRIEKRNASEFLAHFWKYNITCISAFIVKMFILNAVALAMGWPAFVCNLVALCFSGILNFCINEFLVFARRKDKKSKETEFRKGAQESLQENL